MSDGRHRVALALLVCWGVAAACERRAPEARVDTPPLVDTPEVAGVDSVAAPAMEPPAASPSVPGDTTARGIVRSVGADPFARLVLDAGGRSVALSGTMVDELAALAGIEVRVRGRAGPARPPAPARAVEVVDYEIVSVAGRRPTVGVLRQDGDALTVSGIVLRAVPDALREAVGAKVWVVGEEQDGAVVVEAYGIIRR